MQLLGAIYLDAETAGVAGDRATQLVVEAADAIRLELLQLVELQIGPSDDPADVPVRS